MARQGVDAEADSLERLTERLYALAPEDFTAARDAAATANPGERKAVAALRRPTVAAWVVNVLAQQDPVTLEELLALGPALAQAQRAGSGEQLRALSDQRRALLGAVAVRAIELAGREVTAATRAEVESTLDAALADPQAAEAVRQGRLVRALSFAGFGGVDLDGATATPRATPSASPAAKPASRTSAASEREAARLARAIELEAAALEAAGELDDAVRLLSTAQDSQDEHARKVTAAEGVVAEAVASLAAARTAHEQAVSAARLAQQATTRAERAVRSAQSAAERTRAALDALRRS